MRTLILYLLMPFIILGFPLFLAIRLAVFILLGFLTVLEEYMHVLDTIQLIWRRNQS